MYVKSENIDNFKMKYIILISSIFIITCIFFSGIFLFSSKGPLNNIISNKVPDEKNNPVSKNSAVMNDETANLIAQLTADMEKYDKLLASSYLRIVNSENSLPADFASPALMEMNSNPAMKMESVAAMQFEKLLTAASEEGFKYSLIACYRDITAQTEAYNKILQENMNAGYPREEAEILTQKAIAPAGQSEFQTGLLVEISETRAMTAAEFDQTELFTFLKDNAHKYGFVLRYPKDKDQITGYSYNPCIFRYVGDIASSTYIYDYKLTVEEYIEYIKRERTVTSQRLSTTTAETSAQS